MNKFKRGIKNPEFINALNKLYDDQSGFWYKMVTDPELFIAIRDEYLNVYYYGQSVCLLKYVDNVIKGETAKKYLGVNEKGNYISKNGNILNENAIINSLSELTGLKKNIENHIRGEKRESYREILNKGNCIIDVEITFGKKHGYEEKRSMDYLAIEKNIEGSMSLFFHEAKLYENKDNRANGIPTVIDQITKYKEILCNSNRNTDIIETYSLVIKNIKELNFKNAPLFNLIGSDIKLEIDRKPRLTIFKVPFSKKEDKHIEKLRKHFGDRLILKYEE